MTKEQIVGVITAAGIIKGLHSRFDAFSANLLRIDKNQLDYRELITAATAEETRQRSKAQALADH